MYNLFLTSISANADVPRLFVNVWYDTAKKLAYGLGLCLLSRISPDILDRFSQSFQHM